MSEVQTVLEISKNVAKRASQVADAQSLVDYTRPARVEPVTLIDSRAAQLPYIDETLHTALNIFAGYYLQAVSLTANVGRVNVLRVLDQLSPERNPIATFAMESNEDPLQQTFSDQIPEGYSQENVLTNRFGNTYGEVEEGQGGDGSTDIGRGIKEIREKTELSVGKLIEVTIKSEGQSATIPISVRLRSSQVRSDILAHTLSMGKTGDTWKERYHKWRAGQLRFVKDVILAQDLIDEHKKNLIEDDSGYYQSKVITDRKNKIAAVLSGQLSVGTASSIYILTTDTAREIERAIRGKLSRYNDRQKIFKDTYGMLMFVIDPDWEQVTIYHRSIEEPTEVSIREIQRSHSRGGSGPDINEILNAFRQSRSPSL